MKKYEIRRFTKTGKEIKKIVKVSFDVKCPTMFTGSDGHIWFFEKEVEENE